MSLLLTQSLGQRFLGENTHCGNLRLFQEGLCWHLDVCSHEGNPGDMALVWGQTLWNMSQDELAELFAIESWVGHLQVRVCCSVSRPLGVWEGTSEDHSQLTAPQTRASYRRDSGV